MSVLIKGMEMPDNCGQCFAYDTTYRVCNLYFMGIPNRMTSLEHRPEWCELVELPPHGRLGDLDRLEQMFVDIDNAPYSGFDGTEPFYSAEDAAQIIRLAPTIIPAEEGE